MQRNCASRYRRTDRPRSRPGYGGNKLVAEYLIISVLKMRAWKIIWGLLWLAGGLVTSGARAADPKEEDFYNITTFGTPEGSVLEAGAFNVMNDGRLAVATRRGEI